MRKSHIILIIIIVVSFLILGCKDNSDNDKTIAVEAISDEVIVEADIFEDKPIIPRYNKQYSDSIIFANATEFITFRKNPSIDSEQLGRIKTGERMQLISREGKFFKVNYDGKVGYVNGWYTKAKPYMSDKLRVVSNEDGLYSYDDMMADCSQLETQYPSLIKVNDIGKSVWGSDIPVVVFGDEKMADYHVIITGSIHGREYMTTYLIMQLIEYYAYSLSNEKVFSPEYNEKLNKIAFHFIPMANPDGVYISQFGFKKLNGNQRRDLNRIYDKDKYKAEYDSKSDYFERWKSNANGVDLNRNFRYGWDELPVYSPSPAQNKGDKPHSEPEVKLLLDYCESIPLAATISYHTTASQIYYYSGQDGDILKNTEDLASIISKSTGYEKVKNNDTSYVLGGFKDYMIMYKHINSLTIEVGRGVSPVKNKEFNVIWQENKEVLLDFVEYFYYSD